MPRLPDANARQTVGALQRLGFQLKRRSGSHVALWKSGIGTVIVPDHGAHSLPKGTLRSILRMAGVSVDEFVSVL